MTAPSDILDTGREALAERRGLDSLTRLLRSQMLARLNGLRDASLVIIDAGGRTQLGVDPAKARLHASIEVIDDAGFYPAVALNGSVGAAESYVRGEWQCNDLVSLVRILVHNRDLLDAMEGGLARLGGFALRIWHLLRRNTLGGSRRNIRAHYDLGNEMFAQFLDARMMYSSAIYTHEGETLEDAQTRRLDRVCAKLQLGPDDHLLEIGTGWGGMAIHAARVSGCRVTTTTISPAQHALALERVREAGLEDRIHVLLKDYRELEGSYDKLVSLEMIEAIGADYLPVYFEKCASLLKSDGLMLLQAITIEDHRYQQALRSVDFIKRYVFPGSFIPSVSAMVGASARASDLRLINLEDIGSSYALTLRAWRERFHARIENIRTLGYGTEFERLWDFYLCYCEGGFLERSISDVHMLFARPANRRNQYLPDLESRI
jgi:cyclopropane-fatty-acyl-phospholipid synthase